MSSTVVTADVEARRGAHPRPKPWWAKSSSMWSRKRMPGIERHFIVEVEPYGDRRLGGGPFDRGSHPGSRLVIAPSPLLVPSSPSTATRPSSPPAAPSARASPPPRRRGHGRARRDAAPWSISRSPPVAEVDHESPARSAEPPWQTWLPAPVGERRRRGPQDRPGCACGTMSRRRQMQLRCRGAKASTRARAHRATARDERHAVERRPSPRRAAAAPRPRRAGAADVEQHPEAPAPCSACASRSAASQGPRLTGTMNTSGPARLRWPRLQAPAFRLGDKRAGSAPR
jgi:hypothetical protein